MNYLSPLYFLRKVCFLKTCCCVTYCFPHAGKSHAPSGCHIGQSKDQEVPVTLWRERIQSFIWTWLVWCPSWCQGSCFCFFKCVPRPEDWGAVVSWKRQPLLLLVIEMNSFPKTTLLGCDSQTFHFPHIKHAGQRALVCSQTCISTMQSILDCACYFKQKLITT